MRRKTLRMHRIIVSSARRRRERRLSLEWQVDGQTERERNRERRVYIHRHVIMNYYVHYYDGWRHRHATPFEQRFIAMQARRSRLRQRA